MSVVTSFPELLARGTQWCLHHSRTSAAVCVAVLAVSALSASRLRVDPSPEAYLTGAAQWREFDEVNRTYGIGEAVVLALHEPGGTVFDAESVRTVAELDRIVSQMPSVKRVLSIASASVLGNVGSEDAADVIDVGPLLPKGEVTPQSAALLGKRIAGHTVYRRVLIDDSHETAFVLVQLDPFTTDPVSRLSAVRHLRDQADRFASKSRSVHIAGPAVTKEAIASGVQRDTLLFLPAAVALLLVLMWIMFGELVASLVPLCVVGFSSFVAVGVLGALDLPLNMATVTVPTIILVVGLTDSIHLLAELRRQFARTGDREGSLVATIEAIGLPCLLTSLTSAAGFAALVGSRVGPLREFGIAAAIGLVVAYLFSMFLTPVLLSVLRYPKDSSREFVAAPRMGRALTKFAVKTGRNALVPIAVTGLLSGACIAALTMLEINSDFVGYLSADHRLRRDIELIQSTLGGSDTLEVVLSANRPGTFLDPAVLAKADHAGDEIRKLVPGVLSFVDYLKLANSVMDPETGFALPPSAEAVEQLLLLEAEGFPSLSTPDMRQIRMSLQVPTMPSESVRQLVASVRRTATDALAGSDIEVIVTGIPPLFAEVIRYIVEDAASSFGLAALMIWFALLAGLRSFTLATVAMVPNVLPIGLTFATMAVLNITFDTNSAFVACLGIGIAVDDTIHLIVRYQRARQQGSPNSVTALRYALTHAGHPVILSSVLLMVGFSVLCLSEFEPTVRVGMLSAVLLIYAAAFDLLLFPALLLTVDRIGANFEPEMARPSEVTGTFSETGGLLTQPPRSSSDVTNPRNPDDDPHMRVPLI